MTWVSPSGKSFSLMFDELSRVGGKKSVVMEPPQQNRAIVQDLGNKGIRFTLDVYFSSMTYHTDADAFFIALSEPCDSDNPATLNHPRWGDILVCLTGEFTQSEGFVDGMGEAHFAFEVVRVDRSAKFPGLGTDAKSQLKADSDAAQATTIANAIGADSPQSVAQCASNAVKFLTDSADSLRKMTSQVDDAALAFEAQLNAILTTVDDLVTSGSDFAESMITLMLLPANTAIAVVDKVSSIQAIAAGLISSIVDSNAALSLMTATASAVAVAACEATITGDITTRQDAIDSANDIDEIIDALRAAIEAGESSGLVADADTVAAMFGLLSSARARLIDSSFDLKTARVTVLVVSMDPNTAVKLLYGTWTDALLTQFGKDNALEDDEWYMLPPGFEAVWYA